MENIENKLDVIIDLLNRILTEQSKVGNEKYTPINPNPIPVVDPWVVPSPYVRKIYPYEVPPDTYRVTTGEIQVDTHPGFWSHEYKINEYAGSSSL